MRALVICDRNSIATKREEFPARVVEVASSRLHFTSLAHLLQLFQQTYPALCQQPAWNSVLIHYRSSEARPPPPPPNHLGLDFHIYMYIYVRTFLICVRVLVICDRNSIATKREEFPARVVEVASIRLHFTSLARLLQVLQQTYLALCQQPAWNSALVYY